MEQQWDGWVEAAVSRLAAKKLLRSTRPISLPLASPSAELDTFDGPRPWDRSSVEVEIKDSTLRDWLRELPGGESNTEDEKISGKLVLFSGNDYLGLSTHPAVREAASKAAQEHGMGPRGSALICGYTDYHMMLEASLADLKKKEDCLLCPTGFAANMAFMSALGSISSLLAIGRKPSEDERIGIFSDSLNHASIIDGIHLIERQQEAHVFVYRHCDMGHLDDLLSHCTMQKKVVVTDSLFSMDGDFAPIVELVELRKKHQFLLAIDDAHATLVCGKNGGGLPEVYECENAVDICIGTLSKAAGCQGGFIGCSNKWKQLIQSRGRSFIFSTALPVPVAAASQGTLNYCLNDEYVHCGEWLASNNMFIQIIGDFIMKEIFYNLVVICSQLYISLSKGLDLDSITETALVVARKEKWRRGAIWSRVHEFYSLTGLKITSPIISLIIGNEESALRASRYVLKSGFHVTAIRPPTVPPDSCRLRIVLTAAHTYDDIKKLVGTLSLCFRFPTVEQNGHMLSRL